MKKNFSLIIALLPMLAWSQLVLPTEEVIYSFETTTKKKMVLVKGKENTYIQYRFGTDKKIEFTFPKELNEESWSKFTYNTYKKNTDYREDNLEIENISFLNKKQEYLIYRTNFADGGEQSTGIIVKKNGKGNRIDGLLGTIVGSLSQLEETTKLKKEPVRLRF